MMKRMQKFYAKRPPITEHAPDGALVVFRQKSDNSFNRGRVIEYNPDLKKYRVQSIDYGHKVILPLTELFELEKSFTVLPSLAIACSLIDVIRNRSREEIMKIIDGYVELGKPMSCEFVETTDDLTLVNFSIDGVDLRTKMIEDGHLSALPKGMTAIHTPHTLFEI